MAGHRRQHGRPTRAAVRHAAAQRRLAAAQTPEQRLAAAYDAFRSVVAHMTDRSAASRLAADAAQHLLALTQGSN